MLYIDNYKTIQTISENEHSIIYLARQLDIDEPVIIKCLNQDFPSAQQKAQFRKEFENTQKLSSLNGVLQAKKFLNIEHTVAIVYEYFSLQTLASQFKNLPHLPNFERISTSLQIALQLADILTQVHRLNVIHKDINPSNILIDEKGEQVKLIDFGISSLMNQERHGFKNANELEGTLEFMSPEQTGRLNKPLDCRADLYSLGVTFYQLFCGKMPFENLSGIELIHAHIAIMPTAPIEIDKKIPSMISDIILRLLEKMPDDRYQSANGLKKDLENCLQQWQVDRQIKSFEIAKQEAAEHFRLPQKLYGRENEIANIMQIFERCSQSRAELLTVAGYSGTGKTTLVRELHKPITKNSGCFIAGKFEQYQQDIPFFAWIQALDGFVKFLMKEPPSSLNYWRNHIQKALGNIGKVITDLIPALCLLIGEQESVPELAGEQAKNRFYYAFSEFFKAICRPQHPLVIFLDDWQWADPASINLLQYLMADKQLKYLLVIAAYRDNEVGQSHSFALTLKQIENELTPLNKIVLGNLTQDHIHQLMSDCLNQQRGIESLVNLIYEKTQGNAFFVNQFIAQLYQSKLLTYDPQQEKWQWQDEKITSQSITDNVVQLLAKKIMQLPEPTQLTLKMAACVGNRFEASLLSLLLGKSFNEVLESIEPAIFNGIIIPQDLNYRFSLYDDCQQHCLFFFAHDRIQQSAYSLINDSELAAQHLAIAKTMLKKLSSEDIEESLFDLVQHLTIAKSLLIEPDEQQDYIQLNWQAGLKAKATTAYKPAYRYLSNALDCLPSDHWHHQFSHSVALYFDAIEVALLSHHYDSMEKWCDELLAKLDSPLDRIKVNQVRLRAYTAQNRLSDAVEQALQALAYAGIKLPATPKDGDVLVKAMQTKLCMRGKTFEQLEQLPVMQDEKKLKAMELLGLTIPPAYWTSPNLVFLIVFQIARETVKHGYSPMAGFGYSWWGITECAVLGNIDLGYQYGEFGITFAKKNDLSLHQSLFYFGWIIKQFKHHIRESIPVLFEAYKLSLEKGDFEYASYSLNNKMQAHFHCADNLQELCSDMQSAHDILEKFQIGSSVYWHDVWWQTALNFMQEVDNPTRLLGQAYDENKLLAVHSEANDASTLFLAYCSKLMLSVFFADWDAAVENQQQAQRYLKGGVGMFAFVLYHFYSSLSLLRQAEYAIEKSSAKKLIRQVKSNLKKMKKWADFAPSNHLHRYKLIQAEYCRIKGDKEKALENFEAAIELANKNQFLQDEALACEMVADFYQQKKNNRLSSFYFSQAYQLYRQWGALAKVRQLEQTIAPELQQFYSNLTRMHRSNQSASSQLQSKQPLIHSVQTHSYQSRQYQSSQVGSSDLLDMTSILKASQAISSEIVFEQLIKTLLENMLENAGATKGILFFKQDGTNLIAVSAVEVKNGQFHFSPIEQIENTLEYPKSVVNFVDNVGHQVILDDAKLDDRFGDDPYIQKYDCKSLLAHPIKHQGKIIALLYLENNLLNAVYNAERITIINLLSSQMAISLINANHYARLEQEVKLRTREISDKNKQLTKATKAKSDFLAKMSHEIRTPMNAIIGFSRLNLKTRLNSQQKDYAEKVLDASESLLSLINDILDFSKIEAGKLSIESTPFKLDKVIYQAINLSALNAHAKGLELVTDIKEGIPRNLIGDPLRLQQIIVNLVNNAVKFTEKGAVCIQVAPLKESENDVALQFSVIDSGIGMSSEQQTKLFKSFSQADDSVTRKYGGTGLGLAISRQLCELMGGAIWVESEINQGSTFHFTVSLKKCSSTQELVNPQNQTVENLKALVVDDIEIARRVMVDLLQQLGIECDQADSGTRGIEMVNQAKEKQSPYDLVLMDWRMPELDGIEASRLIHQQSDDAPHIIMVSAYDKDEAKKRVASANVKVAEFIEKPFTQSALSDALNRIFNRELVQTPQLIEEPLPPNLSRFNILLVEDNALNRQVAMGYLSDTQVTVEIAENGAVALQKLQTRQFDLVLMDIQMPVMDGYSATHQIREQLKMAELPVIAMTAEAMTSDKEKALAAGMNAHVSKPIDPKQLYATLTEFLVDAQKIAPVHFKNAANDLPNNPADSIDQQALIEKLNCIPSIDATLAISKLSGKQTLYLNLVKDFCLEQKHCASELHKLFQAEQWTELYRLVHSLKSMSAYIGHFALSKMSEKQESLIGNKDYKSVDVASLGSEVDSILNQLQPLFPNQQQEQQSIDFSVTQLKDSLQKILPLLEASDFAVEQHLPTLKQLCMETEYCQSVEEIIQNVNDFEHERAANITNELLARLD